MNAAKYFALLESLELNDINETDQHKADTKSKTTKCNNTNQRLSQNLIILKKYLKNNASEIFQSLIKEFELSIGDAEPCIATEQAEYTVLMEHVLLTLAQNINFDSDAKEDLISTRHTNLFIEAVQHVAFYALSQHLDECFYKSNVFKASARAVASTPDVNFLVLLRLCVECYARLLKIKQLHLANAMEIVIRDFIAAIYSLKLAAQNGTRTLPQTELLRLDKHLNFIWTELSKVTYFHNILLLKWTPQLPAYLSQALHQDLLRRLATKDGFSTLVATLQIAQSGDATKTFEIVANIAACPAYSSRFQAQMIAQVFRFCQTCLENSAMLNVMGAGLLTLRRLYDANAANRDLIGELIASQLKPLITPEDILTGVIVMEHAAFSKLINLLYQLFCTSIVACLPSELLINYLPLLLRLYDNLPPSLIEQQQQVSSLLLRCLDNRETKRELPHILECLYSSKYEANWRTSHKRLLFIPDEVQKRITIKIAPGDFEADELNISVILPALLMSSTHHTLTYKLFMILLHLMAQQLETHSGVETTSVDLLDSETELENFIHTKYNVKLEILLTLNALISFQPLKSQLSENKKDFLQFLHEMLKQRLHATSPSHNTTEATDQTLLVLLTLLQELLEQQTDLNAFQKHDLMPYLLKLRQTTPNLLVQQRIDVLESLLNGDVHRQSASTPDLKAFQTARSLIEAHESHLQVYGIQMLLELLRKKDAATMSQGHLIVALALTLLRNKESYTFLNCVRLFVALINVMEAEVLELLEGEYVTETYELDYRLVVGEAILKVAKELGPLCYRYKGQLLNCFVHGASSTLDEFRMSAFANLAQMCRILAYQVQNFFQELLHLIDAELTTGKYLPAKRAAVLVLSELLEGMDNLIDFDDMLLPIYRLLRSIEADENIDDKMRLHAANGLRTLNEKCIKLLTTAADVKLEKEIRILDINAPPKKRNLSQHILEMN